MMPPDTFHVRLKIIRVLEVFAKNQRRDEILENVPRGSSRFIVIARLPRSDTFTVPSQPFGLQGDNDTLTIRLAPKGCFKRRYQWHGDVMESEGRDFHKTSITHTTYPLIASSSKTKSMIISASIQL